MDKRTFLKALGIGLATAVVAPKALLAKKDNFYFDKETRDRLHARADELTRAKARRKGFTHFHNPGPGWHDYSYEEMKAMEEIGRKHEYEMIFGRSVRR